MTVKDLITKLKKCPKDAQVFAHLDVWHDGDPDSSGWSEDQVNEVFEVGKNKSGNKVVISGAAFPSLGYLCHRSDEVIVVE